MFDLDWLVCWRPKAVIRPVRPTCLRPDDPTIADMYAFPPPFLRAYWRAVADAVNSPFAATITTHHGREICVARRHGVAW